MSNYEKNYTDGSVLNVSYEAAAGIAKDAMLADDKGFRDLDLVVAMEQADLNIRGALLDAYDEIFDHEYDENLEREFILGASLAHKGIRYQASILNKEIPLVDDMSSKGLLTAIKLSAKKNTTYIIDRTWYLKEHNPQILEINEEYLKLNPHYSRKERKAFDIGSIVCYELLYQNIANEGIIDELLNNPKNFN